MTQPSDDLWTLLSEVIPNDHSGQVSSQYYIKALVSRDGQPRVLDLGCGTGRASKYFFQRNPETDWHGVDIENSPEVNQRERTDLNFHTFNGVELPFDDESFDFVYSNQVFEHVRRPEELLREITRVLRPGGSFIGSVSYLEPYHSFSIWNYTPYGWKILLEDAGMKPVEFRPGIDSIALIQRQYRGRPAEAGTWFDLSPLNEEIEAWGTKTKRRKALINLRKIHYCGHLVFHANRPKVCATA